jgi:prophage maintenance system killer protein
MKAENDSVVAENATTEGKGEIVIYRAKDGRSNVEVRLNKETVWLTQRQMADLFDKDPDTIGLHIRNIFKDKELEKKSTTEESSVVQSERGRSVSRRVRFHNLDVIISVGYRVNSKRGTQFRIWATQVLKDHILKGYTVNEKRLKEQEARFRELQETVALMGRIMEDRKLTGGEAEGLLKVVADYSLALSLLDQYDHQQLTISDTTLTAPFALTYELAKDAIARMAERAGMGGGLFGQEKDESFKSSIGAIYQTFGGQDLYPSIEEKAAHLLYFVVKNHSFVDGNKRIAAFLFVWFMDANRILYRSDGTKRIADNALVALTLMIAESKPKDKDIIVKVVVNLINRGNI